MAAVGVIVGFVVALLGVAQYAPIAGWLAAAATYLLWVWPRIGPMGPEETSAHATREDPRVGTTDVLLLLGSVASIVAVVVLLAQAKNATGIAKDLVPLLAVFSIAASWFLVHTLFTLRYARLYYTDGAGGVDFKQKAGPRYADFAYLAFTLGMTFQVSDTDLQNTRIRATALRHALLSYLFGSVILAATVNLIAGLAN
ncbi:DUF1345 domain-containing protein [Galbitalea soli]|uniref:DUF1345 domain-containing protein n=2 Tax=Galbitalea soli TaxID=1268042 RepID=A0A7C9TP66_9MICO|nr:DUF1345 domain-containing protein [Galbitalea soli]NEM90335.1 DUF1345 domain-containing protein [Galbitalea soli]